MPANGPTRSAAPGSGGSLAIWVALHRLRRRRPPQTPSGIDAATLPAELAVVSAGSTGLDKLDPPKTPTPQVDRRPANKPRRAPAGPTTAPRVEPLPRGSTPCPACRACRDQLSLPKHAPPPYDTNGFEPVPSATIRSSTSGEVVFSPSRLGLPAP